MAFIVQRVADGWYFNGFRRRSWSKSVVAAIAYTTKEEAKDVMAERGWRGVVYLALPQVRRKPEVVPGIVYTLNDPKDLPS